MHHPSTPLRPGGFDLGLMGLERKPQGVSGAGDPAGNGGLGPVPDRQGVCADLSGLPAGELQEEAPGLALAPSPCPGHLRSEVCLLALLNSLLIDGTFYCILSANRIPPVPLK